MSCFGVTGELSRSQFEWEITNFLDLSAPKGSFYKSPSFAFDNTSFHMTICPEGDVKAKSGFISLFLENESNSPVHAAFEIHIKEADGTLMLDFSSDEVLQPSIGRGWKNFYKRSDLLTNRCELMPSDILTIVCVMKFVKDGKETFVKQKHKTLDYQRLTELDVLWENLKELSTDKDSCDVLLKVEDKEFKAHRAILMARSHVFAAMFKHDTIEKQTGIVKISDCDSESFQEFLDYFYCGKLEDVSFRSAFHLYSTSKKYDVQELKQFCLEYLKNSLTIDNIYDVVILADIHDETELMAKIQNFFSENCYDIFPTSEWESFMRDHSVLASKLLTELSKTKRS